MRPAVRIEAQRGALILGDTTVQVADVGHHGELRVGGDDGPVLRPVRFGERTRAALWAASSDAPRDNLCAALARAATVREGALDRTLRELVALALAGAGEPRPPFHQTMLHVARAAGWDPAQIADAEAAEVDRLAAMLGAAAEVPETAEAADDGWQRLVWVPQPIAELRDELADRLLARVAPPPRAARANAELGPIAAGGDASTPRSGSLDEAAPGAALVGDGVPGPGAAREALASTAGLAGRRAPNRGAAPREPWPGDTDGAAASRSGPDGIAAPADSETPPAGRPPAQRAEPATEREPLAAAHAAPSPARWRPDEAARGWTVPLALVDPAAQAAHALRAAEAERWPPAFALGSAGVAASNRAAEAHTVRAAPAAALAVPPLAAQPLAAQLGEPLGAVVDVGELADALAELLDDESDLRGVLR